MSHLIEFFGSGCSHCRTMEPLLKKLANETGLKFDQKEVWENSENRAEMEPWTKLSGCIGVPMFVNTKTGDVLCGAVDYKTLKVFSEKS